MKTGNYLFLIAILLGLFIYACTDSNIKEPEIDSDIDIAIQLRVDTIGASCLGEAPSHCQDGTYTWQIVLPQYPNCTFTVSVDYYLCEGLYVNALHLGEFDIYSEFGCPEYIDDLNAAFANGTEEQFYIEFNQSVWRQVTVNILNGFTPAEIGEVLEIEYNIGSCKFLCYTEALDCGDACCRKVNTYRAVNGRWVLYIEGEIEHTGEDCPEDPFGYCDPNVLQTPNCFDNCESLDF